MPEETNLYNKNDISGQETNKKGQWEATDSRLAVEDCNKTFYNPPVVITDMKCEDSTRQDPSVLNSVFYKGMQDYGDTANYVKEETSCVFVKCEAEDGEQVADETSVVQQMSILERKPFSCNICCISFECKRRLLIHTRKHGLERNFQCDICKRRFMREDSYNNHMQCHSAGWSSHTCSVCGNVYSLRKNLLRHFSCHSGIKQFACSTCHKHFLSYDMLREHRKIHAIVKPYACRVCHKRFARRTYLHLHFALHSNEMRFVCHVCKQRFQHRSNLRYHMITHKEPPICAICGDKFATKYSLKVHAKTHASGKPYTCDVCSKTFNSRGVFKRHTRVHRKTFVCATCNTGFASKQRLQRHMVMHMKVKHKCEVCGNFYKRRESLMAHSSKSHRVTPLSCTLCSKRFLNAEPFDEHLKTHATNHHCTVCNKEFGSYRRLKRHSVIHLDIKPYACRICDKKSNSRSALRKHTARMHR